MNKRKKKIIIAFIIFCLSTLLFAVIYFDLPARISTNIGYYLEKTALSIAADRPIEEWPQWVVSYVEAYNDEHPLPEEPTAENEAPQLLPQYADLYAQNNDLIGWIKIDDTKIDYPVMQTKDDPEYYLHRGFDKKYLYEGMLFMDAASDVLLPSANFLIYGHNMKNGTMFGQLTDYRNESFYNNHPIIQFDTIYETGEYEVIAVFLSQIYPVNQDVFKYYQWGLIETEEDFTYYLQNVKALCLYDTGKSAQWGDQLITLSTCYYHTDKGRFVVVARKID